MRWFTDEALANDSVDSVASVYSAHLDEIAHRLPVELRALAMEPHFDLKDGRFREVILDHDAGAITLVIDCGNLQVSYRRLTLLFTDATIEPENLLLLAKAVGAEFRADHWSSGRTVTEIRYTEIDLLPESRFIVRMRLWPFHEFGVAFTGLSTTSETLEDRGPKRAGKFVIRSRAYLTPFTT